MSTRKRYTPEFKTQVALELLKEEKTVSEIASKYAVHSSLLHRWRKEFLEKAPQVFQSTDEIQKAQKAHKEEVENLYTEIGRLTTQLSWLKKSGQLLDS